MSAIIPIIVLFLIIKNVKLDNLKSTLFKLVGVLLGVSILGGLIFTPFGALGLIGLVYYFKYTKSMKEKEKKNEELYGWNAEMWDNLNKNRDTYANYKVEKTTKEKTTGTTLPKKANLRRKICEAFNVKYKLDLTDEQITSIINSSYMSEIWLSELEAMNHQYDSVYQWFNGSTNWLRVYLYVFHVQQVTSDIRAQESIAMYAFQEVFEYADSINGTIADKIEKVNSKFLTSFDDISFMIAYRFLEDKGLKHKLGEIDVIRNDSEIDKLLEKYKDEEGKNTTFPGR